MDSANIGISHTDRHAATRRVGRDQPGRPFNTDSARAGSHLGKQSRDVLGGPTKNLPEGAIPDLCSWDQIVHAHAARIYRLAYRLTGNPHDAADLTQDVFVRVFRSLPTFTGGPLGPWIHRITTNLFLDKVRRERRIRFEAFAADAGDRLPSREPTPGQLLEIQTLNDDVQAALNVLSPGVRAAVVLRDVEGHTHAEIAMALGIKISTVRARLACGRRRLRNALANYAVRGAAQACISGRGPRADRVARCGY